jgi:5'-nucleotidase
MNNIGKKMQNYAWILFDADDTLFKFDSFTGLKLMLASYGVVFSKRDYVEYQKLNKSLWIKYQQDLISAEQLQSQRFAVWGNKLNVDPHILNAAFLEIMAEICIPLDGAVNLLNALQDKVKLGIITNGFTQLQQTRLERTGLAKHFEVLVISEQVGFAKQHPGIFDHAMTLMNHPPREQVLMVGDTLESDIVGGLNAGFHTCWLNANKHAVPKHVKPHYHVTSLVELEKLLLKI